MSPDDLSPKRSGSGTAQRRWRFSPPQVLVIGFAGLIFAGTLLLNTSWATQSGERPGFLTALFTATSAVCVTGLVVVDTGTFWSSFGQAVILFLIQLGGLVIVLYTFSGGFRAVSWTDFFQGLIMVCALVGMPLLALAAVGGYGPLLGKLAEVDPTLVSVTGGKSGKALVSFLVGMLGIGLGYPGQPHVLTRYMAAASHEKIRQSQIIAMVWGVLVFYGAGFLGLAGRLLMPQLATAGDPEQLFPLLAKSMLPPLVAGVMLAAILSAIMSTVSSQLLVAASATSRDLVEQVLGATRSGKASVLAGRLSVLALGLAAVLVAVGEVRVVFWFVLFAWSGLGAAFGPVVLASLFSKRLTGGGALAGIITGFAVTVLWKVTGLSDLVMYELPPAFALAALAAWLISAWQSRRHYTTG
uniref:Sodium/proline symporter n=1 Tax=Thermoanaerobaculum aquaticum TaxID=1312852 RepID=A0A7V1ZH63_9BACT